MSIYEAIGTGFTVLFTTFGFSVLLYLAWKGYCHLRETHEAGEYGRVMASMDVMKDFGGRR